MMRIGLIGEDPLKPEASYFFRAVPAYRRRGWETHYVTAYTDDRTVSPPINYNVVLVGTQKMV